MKRIFLPLLLLTLGVLLSACSGGTGTATGWPGLSASEDTAFVAYNQHVYAVDITNGVEKWRFPEEANNKISFFASPMITPDGQLLAGGYDHVLYSLDPAGGDQKWAFPASTDQTGATDRYVGSPLATEMGIFAPNADGNLYALDPQGKYRWSFTTERAQWAKPVTDPACTCIYLPSMDHRLYSINSQTGAVNWESEELGGALVGSPAFDPEGRLYIGTFNSEMLALDANSGKVIWRAPTSDWAWGGPVLKDGVLYFGDLGGTFYALDAAKGQEIWKAAVDGVISDAPLVTDDTIYFGTEAGTLYALELNGKEKWKQPIKEGDKNGKLYTTPVLAGDTLLVTATGTQPLLYAFDLNGAQKWTPFTPEKK
jgi:outer membrane protein assembly factor BamB